ncbi:MAG: 16S rRNA (adenine(1518)-N(6)/adenine(1519)-N(6))-dimethyltransferase RsmA [Actinomycetota bacterium]
MTHSPTELRALLDRHGLSARRALGQNFVVDPNTVRRIVALSGAGDGDPVIEIGPGLGSLTLALIEVGASITAVEMDTELVPILREVVAHGDVTIVEGDAQHVAWDDVLADHPAWRLVANLPYNVATPLILDLLRSVPPIREMLVMVQLEVAERLAATVPNPAIGIPSVLVAYHGTATIAARIPPTVFHPRPRVDSALVRIVRHETPPIAAPIETLEPLVRAAYRQRRKMIRKSLAGLASADQMMAAGIDPQARPETLSIESWGRLATEIGTR